jgi:hypothetical protein
MAGLAGGVTGEKTRETIVFLGLETRPTDVIITGMWLIGTGEEGGIIECVKGKCRKRR